MENGSSICLPWWLQLTGWAYLHSRLLWVWLPLTAPTADKRGNIKENRRAAELRHQCFFSSSHPPPHLPPPSPLPKQQLPLLLVFSFPYTAVSELSEGGCDITRIRQKSRGSSRQRQPVLCQASPKASCDPALVSAHQDCWKGSEKKYLTECFSILLTDRIVFSSPVSASRYVEGFQIGNGENLACENKMNYWVWTKCQNCSIALRGIPEKLPRCDHGTNTQDWVFKKAEKGIFFLDRPERVWLYQVKENAPLNSYLALAWQAFGNLHSEDLAQCQLIWRERSSLGEECFGFSFHLFELIHCD